MLIPPASAYATTLQVMAVPIAAWCGLSSLQLIMSRHAFMPGRALGPDLAALSRGRVIPAILSSPLCAPPALLIVPMVRLSAGIALPFVAGSGMGMVAGTTTIILLVVIVACTALLSVATGGSDGADKIALVACVAALLIALGIETGDRWLCLAGVAWGAGQVTIAYATAGTAKLVRPFWRDGTALVAAMTSYASGHAVAAAIVRHRHAAIALTWMVMLVETLFPLALLVPPGACLAALAALAIFHVATAILMGLNTYPWAFVATYPCVLMANGIIIGAPSITG